MNAKLHTLCLFMAEVIKSSRPCFNRSPNKFRLAPPGMSVQLSLVRPLVPASVGFSLVGTNMNWTDTPFSSSVLSIIRISLGGLFNSPELVSRTGVHNQDRAIWESESMYMSLMSSSILAFNALNIDNAKRSNVMVIQRSVHFHLWDSWCCVYRW